MLFLSLPIRLDVLEYTFFTLDDMWQYLLISKTCDNTLLYVILNVHTHKRTYAQTHTFAYAHTCKRIK